MVLQNRYQANRQYARRCLNKAKDVDVDVSYVCLFIICYINLSLFLSFPISYYLLLITYYY